MLGLSIQNLKKPAYLKRIFPTNIPHLHNFIPRDNFVVGKGYCTNIFCDDPPVCGATQISIVLQLYIIATPEFLHHNKYFNWHLVPKTISDISPRIQLFYFRCGWPSLLTNISMRVDVPRRIKVITGKNCCVYVCVCVCV